MATTVCCRCGRRNKFSGLCRKCAAAITGQAARWFAEVSK